MKKFSIPIKQHISDFCCTKNIWLNILNHNYPYHFIKKDSTLQLLFGLALKRGEKESFEICRRSDDPRKAFEQLKQKEFPGGDYILLDVEKSIVQLCGDGLASWVLFHCEKGGFEILENNKSSSFQDEDFIISFYHIIPQKTLQFLCSKLLKTEHISFSLLKEIDKTDSENNLQLMPLCLVNRSFAESYSFSIKSTLNAVSLTIEMIKNKIIKYHSEKLWQIETVLHEALVNAITYGNELDDSRLVDIRYEIGPKAMRLWIRDAGEGFDVLNTSVPVGEEALDRISGRGLYIMKKFSEEIYFNSKGNELLLYFEF